MDVGGEWWKSWWDLETICNLSHFQKKSFLPRFHTVQMQLDLSVDKFILWFWHSKQNRESPFFVVWRQSALNNVSSLSSLLSPSLLSAMFSSSECSQTRFRPPLHCDVFDRQWKAIFIEMHKGFLVIGCFNVTFNLLDLMKNRKSNLKPRSYKS